MSRRERGRASGREGEREGGREGMRETRGREAIICFRSGSEGAIICFQIG